MEVPKSQAKKNRIFEVACVAVIIIVALISYRIVNPRQFKFPRYFAENESFVFATSPAVTQGISYALSDEDSSKFFDIILAHSLLRVFELFSAQRDDSTMSVTGFTVDSGAWIVNVMNKNATHIQMPNIWGNVNFYVPLEPERLARELREWYLGIGQ